MQFLPIHESLRHGNREYLARIPLELPEATSELRMARQAFEGVVLASMVGVHRLVDEDREVKADEETGAARIGIRSRPGQP
jgi:hypothetical protein